MAGAAVAKLRYCGSTLGSSSQRLNQLPPSPSSYHLAILPPHALISLAMPATTADALSIVARNVTVAPLVLLSAADHYGRTAKGTKKRVVGVLLGENTGQTVRVSNSFASMLPVMLIALYSRLQFPSRRMRRTLRSGS